MNKHIEKQLKTRDKNLKYDFLPSIIEIIEKPANRVANIIILLLISFIIITVIWAYFFKIDISIVAQGTVAYKDTVVSVTSLSQGTLSEVLEREIHVNEGDVICKFSTEAEEEALDDYQHKLEVDELKKKAYEMLYEKYKKEDYTSLIFGNELDNNLVVEEIVTENELFLYRLEIENEDNQVLLKKNQLFTVSKNLNDIDSEIRDINAKIKELNVSIEYKTIIASKTGVFVPSDDLYIGKTIKQGDVIGYIIPEEKEYIFTAYVSDEDINDLNIGDIVNIKINAYHETRYQVISGVVENINQVPANIENKGIVYKVDILLNDKPDSLMLGMEGTVDIVTGKRSVLDYFLEPFIDGLKNSLKEK